MNLAHRRARPLSLELLEDRLVLSSTTVGDTVVVHKLTGPRDPAALTSNIGGDDQSGDDGRWIFGNDDRQLVGNTVSDPWKMVGRLIITMPNGNNYLCSGALVSPIHLLTAAHCIYDDFDGGFAKAISVGMAQNGALKPYGTAYGTNIRTYEGWTQGTTYAAYNWDMALITLDRPVGYDTGWFSYEYNNSDAAFSGMYVTTAGYPGLDDRPTCVDHQKSGSEMYWTAGPYTYADTYKVFYNGTLDACGGQSGSAMWRDSGGKHYINSVLSHGNGNITYNVSTRITQGKYDDITEWIITDGYSTGGGGELFDKFPPYFAVGGAPGFVELRSSQTGAILRLFAPFGAGYKGGVTVAVGDLNADGHSDLIVGAANGNPHVKVYNGKTYAGNLNPDAALMVSFFPYALQFNVGTNVAVGDVNGDGFEDLVTGARGGNPHVKVYNGYGLITNFSNPEASRLTEFFAYGLQFNVGANVAVADFNRDGYAEVVTGATAGNPHVKVINGNAIATGWFNPNFPGNAVLTKFFAFGLQFNVGALLSTGDVDGDGYPDLIVGASSGNPHIKVYHGLAIALGYTGDILETSKLTQFFAYTNLGPNLGVRVGAMDFNADGRSEIITAPTSGLPFVRVVPGLSVTDQPPALFEDIPSIFNTGVFVGG